MKTAKPWHAAPWKTEDFCGMVSTNRPKIHRYRRAIMAKEEFDCTSLTAEQRDARLALDVERLLRFGRKYKLIKDLDVLVARNTLLDLLGLSAPCEAKPPKEQFDTPAKLLDEMVELAA